MKIISALELRKRLGQYIKDLLKEKFIVVAYERAPNTSLVITSLKNYRELTLQAGEVETSRSLDSVYEAISTRVSDRMSKTINKRWEKRNNE